MSRSRTDHTGLTEWNADTGGTRSKLLSAEARTSNQTISTPSKAASKHYYGLMLSVS